MAAAPATGVRAADRPPVESWDAVVVGAGIGGLVAAALLARHGRRVVVVERHAVAGGNASIFRRRGYEFDVGLHYVGGCGPDGALTRILRAAGAGDVEFLELDPDGYDTIVLPGLRFAVPRGLDHLRERLAAAFPGERRGIDRWCALLGELRRALAVWPRPLASLAVLARAPQLRRWSGATLGAFLASCTRDPLLAALLGGWHVGYALPPSRASVLVGAGIALHYLDGAFYPRGGGQAPADRLVAAIESRGGEVRLRTRVERIVVEGGRVLGVEIHGRGEGPRRLSAPTVISNADVKRTVSELAGEAALGPRFARAARRWHMAPALAVAYLGLRGDLRAEGHRAANDWVHAGLDAEPQYAQAARGELPDDPSAFVTVATLKDPGHAALAPPGHDNVQVMGVAPCQPEAWGVSAAAVADGSYRADPAYRAAKRRWAERMLDALQRVVPDARARVAHLEIATPLTQQRYTGSTGGTAYGLAATPGQMRFARPGPATPVSGLYLCGASTRTGHGIVGAALSGLAAAARALPGRLDRAVLG